MRIVNTIPHPFFVVEIFFYAEKYTLKIKFRGLEQSYPIPTEHLDATVKALNDPGNDFYTEASVAFKTMQTTLVDMLKTFDSGNFEEEEII